MRLVRFGGAMSLDGYIAGPNGEYDWIVMDPDIDFSAMARDFDTFLIGRKTFDVMKRMGNEARSMGGITNLAEGLVDRIEMSLMPVLLGSGTIGLEYDILR